MTLKDKEKLLLALDEYKCSNIQTKKILNKYNIKKTVFYYYLNKYNIKTRDKEIHGRVYSFNIDKLIIDSQDKFYWIGFITADGNISNNHLSLSIQLKNEDKGHLEKFKKFLEAESPIKEFNTNAGNKTCKISINSKELCDYLVNNYNIIPNKSLSLKFPQNIPKQYINDYIRGYFDGDGSIWFTKKQQPTFSICSGSKEYLIELKNNLNINNSITFSGNVWRFSVAGNNKALKLFERIYKDSKAENRLDRKYKRYLSIFDNRPNIK